MSTSLEFLDYKVNCFSNKNFLNRTLARTLARTLDCTLARTLARTQKFWLEKLLTFDFL